ncbi:MAG: ATP-binding protein, partial [Candidatus Caldatribacterium sp.]|nr:ATP-binding protein [Candidatus Caldatribacterium sp.]
KDLGKCLENTVFLELRHRKAKRPSMEVFYWQDSRKREVDFVVTEGESVKELIQVCAEVSGFRVEEREVAALLKASEELGCDKLTVVTLDYEGEKEVGGKRVVFRKLLRWLLEEG